MYFPWHEASAVIVISGGCLYLVDANDPASYAIPGSPQYVKEAVLDSHRTTLFVAYEYSV